MATYKSVCIHQSTQSSSKKEGFLFQKQNPSQKVRKRVKASAVNPEKIVPQVGDEVLSPHNHHPVDGMDYTAEKDPPQRIQENIDSSFSVRGRLLHIWQS